MFLTLRAVICVGRRVLAARESQTVTNHGEVGGRYFRRSQIVSVCLLTAAGCGGQSLEGTIPVSGRVVYQGSPLIIGEVRYMPLDDANGRVARGQLDQDGNFELTTLSDGDGALPGEYHVVVIVFPEDARGTREESAQAGQRTSTEPPIPLRYYSPDTSGLTDTVNKERPGFREFELVE